MLLMVHGLCRGRLVMLEDGVKAFFFFFLIFIHLFVFACAGSSFLHIGVL